MTSRAGVARSTILVVGAGPVGLITALILGRAGHRVTLIDAEEAIVESPRAMSYAWPVLDGLAVHGLLDDMHAQALVNRERAFRVMATGETIVQNHAAIRNLTANPYTLTLGQDRLARVVLAQLATLPDVDIRWDTRFRALRQTQERVEVTVERFGEADLVQADWVVGADGGRSEVRKALGFGFAGVTWPRRFVATNIFYDFARHGWRSGYQIDPIWGAVIAQVTPEGIWRVTFSESEALPVETVEERIHAYLRHVLPGPEAYDLRLFSAYSMHQRTAPSYRAGRVLLAGDAAHVTNPTSGFGLVGGMYDAMSLGETLSAVAGGEAEEALLDRWAEERRRVFLTVTSPVSADSMRLIFYCDEPVRLEHDLITLRARAADERSMRAALMVPASLETPSLLTGLTFAQRRYGRS